MFPLELEIDDTTQAEIAASACWGRPQYCPLAASIAGQPHCESERALDRGSSAAVFWARSRLLGNSRSKFHSDESSGISKICCLRLGGCRRFAQELPDCTCNLDEHRENQKKKKI